MKTHRIYKLAAAAALTLSVTGIAASADAAPRNATVPSNTVICRAQPTLFICR